MKRLFSNNKTSSKRRKQRSLNSRRKDRSNWIPQKYGRSQTHLLKHKFNMTFSYICIKGQLKVLRCWHLGTQPFLYPGPTPVTDVKCRRETRGFWLDLRFLHYSSLAEAKMLSQAQTAVQIVALYHAFMAMTAFHGTFGTLLVKCS